MKRKPWIDHARGICAFCVLLAHQTSNEVLSHLYNGFFLMLFFFISGYLYRDRSIKDSFINLYRSLIIPYIGLSILGTFLYSGNIKEILNGNIDFIQEVLYKIAMGRSLWFVSCLVCVRLLYVAVYSLLSRLDLWNKHLVLCISIFSILSICFQNGHPANDPPFWYCSTAVYSFGFYLLGYLSRAIKMEDKLSQLKWHYGCLLIIGYSVISSVIQSCSGVEFHVYTDTFESPLTFILLATAGIFCVLTFSISVSEFSCIVNRYIISLGQNSLLLFAINSKIRLTLEKLVEILRLPQSFEIFYIILICIVQGGVILIIGYFVNNYIPWLVGKHK